MRERWNISLEGTGMASSRHDRQNNITLTELLKSPFILVMKSSIFFNKQSVHILMMYTQLNMTFVNVLYH